MKIKRMLCLLLAVILTVAMPVVSTNAEEIEVELDDEKVECNVPARIDNGRTMVPMRAIFEAFGMKVDWNNEDKSVTAVNDDKVIKLTVGEKTLYVNGETVVLDVAPYIEENTTFVPVRAVSESLDATVTWNDEKRRVEIVTAQYEANKDAWKENTGEIDLAAMVTEADGVEIKDRTVYITKGGDFSLTGENGDVMIHVDTKEKVKLRLQGVNITNPSGPAIFFENSDKSLITVSKGTENFVADGSEYAVDAKAAIFSNDDIEIKGEGKLTVTSIAHHALASDDDIKIEEGTLVLESKAKDAIHANNEVKITGGSLTITAKGDGIQAEENVLIEGGEINVITTGEVAQSQGGFGNFGGFGDRGNRTQREQVMRPGQAKEYTMPPERGQQATPNGMMPPEMEGVMPPDGMGNMMPPIMGQPAQESPTEDEATATKGIKAGTDITVTGGKIVVDAADHAVHSAATISVTGGEMLLKSKAGKGISAHGNVLIEGGKITVEKATEGLESKMNFTVNGGEIYVNATDDGINAGGTGGRDVVDRRNSEAETGHDLIINGGKIFVNAAGDGLDANGRMIINGGDIVVEGPTNSGNGALDSGGVIKVNGGTLIALGASGMAETPGNDSLQPAFRLVTDKNIPAGSLIKIADEAGNEIYSYTTIKQGNSIVFSSAELKVGKTYKVNAGDGEYTVTMNTVVTNVGNGGFGGRGR